MIRNIRIRTWRQSMALATLAMFGVCMAAELPPPPFQDQVEIVQIQKDIKDIMGRMDSNEKSAFLLEIRGAKGDVAKLRTIVNGYKAKLPGNQASAGKPLNNAALAPTIDLEKYKVIEMPKQANWVESEPGDSNGKGHYIESAENGQIKRIKVGVWEKVNPQSGQDVESRGCWNAQGVHVGPEITYYVSGGIKKGQIKSIVVWGGFSLADKVGDLALSDVPMNKTNSVLGIEQITFFPSGALSSIKKIESDGSCIEKNYLNNINSNSLILDVVTKADGARSEKNYSPMGLLIKTVDGVVKNGLFDVRIKKEWRADTGDLSLVEVPVKFTVRRYMIPAREAALPPTAKQAVIWFNPDREEDGVKAAGYATGPNPEDRLGQWAEFNEHGSLLRQGTYKAGKPDGVWTEMEYLVEDGNNGAKTCQEIASSKGRYADGVKVGIWTTSYSQSHPLVVEAQSKKEKESNKKPRGMPTAGASMNSEKGYLETNTYTDGKITNTTRNF